MEVQLETGVLVRSQLALLAHCSATSADGRDAAEAVSRLLLEAGPPAWQVYTPERTQVGSAAVDITIKTPAGDPLVTAYHTNEDERSITSRGPRVRPHLVRLHFLYLFRRLMDEHT